MTAQQVFLDIDTQNDFVLPAGALYAPGAERIVPTVAALNRYAQQRGIPLISTTCYHEENDAEFQKWPPHCIQGTVGQRKPCATLVGGSQRIFEKQTTDAFRSPKFLPLLEAIGGTEYFVYGVVTEVCVRFAAEGLLQFGRPVTIVTDAIQALDRLAGQEALLHFVARGGHQSDSSELMSRR